MPEAVIIDAARTPMGRYGGILKDIRPDDLAAHVIAKLIAETASTRTPRDVILAAPTRPAKIAATWARNASCWPAFRIGARRHRQPLWASGLEAVNQAGRAVGADEWTVRAGGVEDDDRARW